ncbi:MAG TPA: hypothetical protein VGC65_02100, partial [Bacteroidia bacterium]
VGAVLFKNGRPFLINTFSGNQLTADAVNKFLLAGYYLVNIGYTVIALRTKAEIHSLTEMLNVLGCKAGTIILTLGLMHLINVMVLVCIGRNKRTLMNTHQ